MEDRLAQVSRLSTRIARFACKAKKKNAQTGTNAIHGRAASITPGHPTTRSFLSSETGHALPPYLRERLRQQPGPDAEAAIRILFRGRHATDPVLSQLTRELGLDVSILSGSVDEIAGRPFGTLVVGLRADEATVRRALSFLTSRDLDAEVIGHVA